MVDPELSPVEISLAAAIALGFRGGQFRRNASPASLNVLLHYEEGCVARCAYCGHHAFRAPSGSEKTFIRVPWPVHPAGEVCERLRSGTHGLRRVCVGMVTHRRAFDDMNALIRLFREGSALPVSALIAPTMIRNLDDLEAVKLAGADRVGIALDAATPELFDRCRGSGVAGPHTWSHYWRAIEAAVSIFGRRMVGAHLVVGLGESEKEMVEAIQRLHDAGAQTHLFSFFPEPGTTMSERPQPAYGHYRRVQLARYIVNQNLGRAGQMNFDAAGRIRGFGIDVERLLHTGEPFMTSGCPGSDGAVACNRPFGNERAGQPFRNFPFLPEPEDTALVGYQIREYPELQ